MNEIESYVKEPNAIYATKTVSIHEAKTNFSKLVKRAEAGEAIYIGAYGKPAVVMTAVDQKVINAKLRAQACGCMKGSIEYKEGWDNWTDEELYEMFYSNIMTRDEFFKS
ncbi:MAG: type II toxin-antitoxin system prevent-host-death family antitoxin [Treponema sp.]|nr:type II toxin-antitoxin system prevent-host-death family antitoxin [Treponema sp.]